MFAQAENLIAYWRTLLNGLDCITEPPPSHQQLVDGFDRDPKRPDHIYCNRGGFLPPVDFDPTEFGIPPSALEATDTSQLLGLVAAKAALADAGYGDGRDYDRDHTSVILGVTGTQELVISLGSRLGHPHWRRALEEKGLSASQKDAIIADIADSYVGWQENSFPGLLGNVVAGRICNRLNLGGTNCVVDAACASSLSAIHLALMELYTGKSNMAVTGGVDTINDIFMHMCFARTGVLSHTGDARPFSADADGTVLGEGIGIMVLKRLADAERDGDRIYAVIRGIGSSSDGKSQSIYAPRAEGQTRALNEAYGNAGVDPESIGLVEAHGTGTRVGDEVEFSALKHTFKTAMKVGRRCALGSVKSMIGHTKAAAGAAGLIKASLALFNKVLPPTLKATTPDPKLEIEASPFYLSDVARPWFKVDNQPRRSGVSAFGFGGSNFHVVLEEYQDKRTEIAWDGSVQILAFSGSDHQAIVTQIDVALETIGEKPESVGLARTAAALRSRFSSDHPHRLVAVVHTLSGPQEAVACLTSARAIAASDRTTVQPAEGVYYVAGAGTTGETAFLYPGQGSQYPGMGRDLVCRFPAAMQAVEDVAAHFDDERALWDYLYPEPARSQADRDRQDEALRRTNVAQPAIGAISLAMTAILSDFGIIPNATAGHSYGELPALFAAGRIDRETLAALSALRGRLMADAGKNGDAGTMVAVKAPIQTLEQLVGQMPGVVLANVNSPTQGVLSGASDAIAAARETLSSEGLRSIDLPVAAAFHSSLVEKAREPFSTAVADAAFTPSTIPVYANLSAAPYPTDPAAAAELLGRQLTGTVRFKETVERLYADGVRTFVEVGPKGVLSGLVRETLADHDDIAVVTIDRSGGKTAGILDLAHAIAHLAARGANLALDRWERVPETPRPRKMSVPLSGANYRSARKTKPRTVQAAEQHHGASTTQTARAMPAKPAPAAGSAGTAPKPTIDINQNPMPSREPMKTQATPEPERPSTPVEAPDRAQSPQLHDALAVVQKGMASIQALQTQTAKVHQTFLETQAQAGRTLQEMMASTRQLVGALTGTAAELKPSTAAEPRPTPPTLSEPQTVPDPVVRPQKPVTSPLAADQGSGVKTAAPEEVPTSVASTPTGIDPGPTNTENPGAAIAEALTGVVSELTGYPTEMLEMSMDIEADLGIDSIKRVEILSAMEARMPHLPQVTPDMVGTLKTLGQICDFLAAGGGQPQAAVTGAPVGVATPPAAAGADEIQNTLVAVVSELTGYPTEMLEMSMDIEADLGIDSIKRVEILSAMEARMPHLPQVTPDMVGTLKTLGQICDFLAAGGGQPQAAVTGAPVGVATPPAAAGADEIQNTLVAVVSELTGYPTEMLEMSMDIEADLGIDSIKRVEILSAMEARMPHLPQVTPDMVGTLKTLGQICDFLAAGGGQPQAAVTGAPVGVATPPAAAGADEIQNTLVAVVSELTGYPTEMLEMSMDIEADLGIDSIKRVEILSAMEARMPHLPQVTPDMVGTLKTLGQICGFLAAGSDPGAAHEVASNAETPAAETAEPATLAPVVTRQIIDVVPLAKGPSRPLALPAEKTIVLLEDGGPLSAALAGCLTDRGLSIRRVCAVDIAEKGTFENAAGLILMPDISAEDAFLAARCAGPRLMAASRAGDTLFVAITTMDGAFGFSGGDIAQPRQGALPGLVKTAALEWPGVVCRAVDLAPAFFADTSAAVGAIASELLDIGDGQPVEIGLDKNRRVCLTTVPAETIEGRLNLDASDVVIVTGGARGVTASCALALAKASGASIALIGRSDPPTDPPAWLEGVGGEAAIKKAIATHGFSDGKPTPKALEEAYRHHVGSQAIRQTLAELAETGVRAAYFSADVTDSKEVAGAIQSIHQELGNVTAIIHGAGVLHDRLIVDKQIAQFRQVYATKVQGLENVLAQIDMNRLHTVVLFSSVAARTGNTGQCDYAMANEVLNKMAHGLALAHSDCRVVAINWGPWDGGMVTPSLKKAFAHRNIDLIPLEVGARMMVAELQNQESGPVEVVVGGMLTVDQEAVDARNAKLALLERRAINLERYPVLASHVIGGRPVVPFALIGEWIGHGALKQHPGLSLHGIDDFRLLSGIRIETGDKMVRLMAGKAISAGDALQVDIELRNGVKNGRDVIHSRARALLVDRLPAAPPYRGNGKNGSRPYTRDLDHVYAQILFHGDQLRAIRAIESYSEHGMTAHLVGAPAPSAWMEDPIRERWTADPMVLDGAFQMAIVWCYEQTGNVCLPSYARAYRQYSEGFPPSGVSAVMNVTALNHRKMVADFTFLDEQRQVVATLNGYEATIDQALMHAFQDNGRSPSTSEDRK